MARYKDYVCSEETRAKISAANKNRDPILSENFRRAARLANLGRKRPQCEKDKISATMKGRTWTEQQRQRFVEKRKALWANPEYKNEMVKRMRAGHSKHGPNKAEQRLRSILHMLYGRYAYVGQGEMIVDGCNPDFYDSTEKRIIELYGEWWHRGQDPQDKVQFYEERGYKALVIWWEELTRKDSEEAIRKLVAFDNRMLH